MRKQPLASQRGAALASVILLSVFLLIVGMAFLTTVERDAYFQSHSERQAEAYFTARSGLEFYFFQEQSQGGASSIPPGASETYNLDPLGYESFTLTQLPANGVTGSGCIVTGYVKDTMGHTVGQRTLVLPNLNDMSSMYEPNYR